MATIMRVGGGGAAKKKATLETIAEGALVAARENGVLTPFYLAKKDYEADINGNGRYLLVRKQGYKVGAIDAQNVNTYDGCDMDIWFNNTYLAMLSGGVKAKIGVTQFFYTVGNGNTAVTALAKSVFALSLTEFGLSGGNVEGTALPIAGVLRIAYVNGAATNQWTRSAFPSNKQNFYCVDSGGKANVFGNTSAYAYRPCFTLPADMEIADEPNADGSYTLLCDADV